MIGGLANKSDDPSWMRQTFDLVSNAPRDINVSNLAGSVLTSAGSPIVDMGKRFLSGIFGSRQNAVNDAVARGSGLGSSVVTQLMGIAAPLLLSVLGRRVREGGLTPASLRSDLLGEAAGIRHLLPAGVANIFDTSRAPAEAAHEPVRSRARWFWPAVAAVALALLGTFWAINRSRNRLDVAQLRDAANSSADRVASAAARLGDFVTRKLPGNIDLRIPEYGVEGRLLAFIQTSPTANTETWFDFDRLVFDTNSATLRPESQEQLQNIAAILKAYPNVRVKIGGYTDSTGDPDANLRLSQARANSVTADLARLGVSSDRMEAQGYGAQYPVADNSTEEGRARNRRISIRVTSL
jgi:outer membrane protein OmpA-like peptidoglycan-associated protein